MLTIILMITHAAVSLALIIIVLLQQGKQQGLSGAIAGAGETFFGKSKARTIDSMLKKFTTVVATLFIVNSIGLYFVMAGDMDQPPPWGADGIEGLPPGMDFDLEGMEGFTMDEDGNLIIDPDLFGDLDIDFGDIDIDAPEDVTEAHEAHEEQHEASDNGDDNGENGEE